jgi:hypothetical protein
MPGPQVHVVPDPVLGRVETVVALAAEEVCAPRELVVSCVAEDFVRLALVRIVGADCAFPRMRPVGPRATGERPSAGRCRLDSALTGGKGHAPGRIRTCDFCLRRAALYPLSYGRRGADTRAFSGARGSPRAVAAATSLAGVLGQPVRSPGRAAIVRRRSSRATGLGEAVQAPVGRCFTASSAFAAHDQRRTSNAYRNRQVVQR